MDYELIINIYFTSTYPLQTFYFNLVRLMLPYSLILAAYSSIRVPYRELPVAYQIFPTREQLIPSVGMYDSQCGNVLFPRREQKGCPLLRCQHPPLKQT